jgi:hypothetical protein
MPEKTIKVRIKKKPVQEKTIKIRIKNKVIPDPEVKTLEWVLNEKIRESQEEPILYSTDSHMDGFFIIHLLKTNNSVCAMGWNKEDNEAWGIDFGEQFLQRNTPEDNWIQEKFVPTLLETYERRCLNKKEMPPGGPIGEVMAIPLGLPGHANLLIINPYRKEFERFEPQEAFSGGYGIKYEIETEIMKPFNEKFKTDFEYVDGMTGCYTDVRILWQSYDHKQSRERVKRDGVVIKDPKGFCIAWTWFYADLRLKFPLLSQKEIVDRSFEILTKNPLKLRSVIRGQAFYVMKMVEEIYPRSLLKINKANKQGYYDHNHYKVLKVWRQYLRREFRKL